MSGLLARLQAEGLLRREVNPDDRREVLVHLTPAGVQLRQDTIQRLQAADRLLAQPIDRDDLDRLCRIVARLGDLI
jgi:MarR family transcriptional regulator, organic hydroperoxide resistance regulator